METLALILQVAVIIAVCIGVWEGIIKPSIAFILLHMVGKKFLVRVSYGSEKNPATRDYGIMAISQDFAIIKGLKAFEADWNLKSDKIPLSCVLKVTAKLVK